MVSASCARDGRIRWRIGLCHRKRRSSTARARARRGLCNHPPVTFGPGEAGLLTAQADPHRPLLWAGKIDRYCPLTTLLVVRRTGLVGWKRDIPDACLRWYLPHESCALVHDRMFWRCRRYCCTIPTRVIFILSSCFRRLLSSVMLQAPQSGPVEAATCQHQFRRSADLPETRQDARTA